MAPALAQDEVDAVVVTGTRIKTPGLVANSPISSVGAEEIALNQPVAVEEFFKALPGAVPAIGPGTNNGAGGGATIDLRGLGPQRTLVLMDGRRLVPFNLTGQVDTNSIPIALIQRVDLVTGGASAVYGADAVTGVVNFVMRRDFEGVDLTTSYGTSDESDATRQRIDLTMGGNFADGRGNAVFSLGYTDVDSVRQDQRDYGLFALSSTSGAPQGSGTGIPAAVTVNALNAPNPDGTCSFTPGSCTATTGQVNTTTGAIVAPFNSYNFNPDNFYQTPLERYQATAFGRYEFSDNVEIYGQLLYTRSDVSQQLAPSGIFLNVLQVPIGNPYLPDAARQQICLSRAIPAANCVVGNPTEVPMTIGRRLTELGPRLGNFENKTFQYTVGFRGDIGGNWSYDAYFSHGEADQVRTLGNWGSLSKVQQALRALNVNTCTSTANGCVPLNAWGPEGSVTPAMVGFINLSSMQLQVVEQDVAAAFVSGDLGEVIKSPWASSPIGVAVGVEYREMEAGNRSDSASQIQGEVMGTGAPLPDRSGTFDLKEVYAEALIPIVSDVPGIHSLTLEGGYRYSEFTVVSSDNYGSYKYGLEWAPIEGLRFRGMFQRATRSPNINELFAPQVSGLSNLAVDPCGGAAINIGQANTAGTLSNLCRLTGVPVALVGSLPQPSAGQINIRTGGNLTLGPELADSETFGAVWQPSFVSGLTLSLDYWKVEVEDAISTPSVTDILTQCYGAALNPSFAFNSACALVLRSPNTGTFNGVDAPGVVTALSNQGYLKVDGWDLGIQYSHSFENERWGTLQIRADITKVENTDFQATPASVYRQCNGFYSVACGQPNVKEKWNQRTTWLVGDFDLSYTWRHLGSTIEEPGGTNFLPAFASISAIDYFDLAFGYNVTEQIRTTLSVVNALDEEPPIVGNTIGTTGTNSGNTFPQTFDTIGRFWTLGVNVKF